MVGQRGQREHVVADEDGRPGLTFYPTPRQMWRFKRVSRQIL